MILPDINLFDLKKSLKSHSTVTAVCITPDFGTKLPYKIKVNSNLL